MASLCSATTLIRIGHVTFKKLLKKLFLVVITMQKTSLLEKVREMCRIAVGRVNTFVVSKFE